MRGEIRRQLGQFDEALEELAGMGTGGWDEARDQLCRLCRDREVRVRLREEM